MNNSKSLKIKSAKLLGYFLYELEHIRRFLNMSEGNFKIKVEASDQVWDSSIWDQKVYMINKRDKTK